MCSKERLLTQITVKVFLGIGGQCARHVPVLGVGPPSASNAHNMFARFVGPKVEPYRPTRLHEPVQPLPAQMPFGMP